MPAAQKANDQATHGALEANDIDRPFILESIIPYQISLLEHHMNRKLDAELRSHGLSISTWRIMAVLDYSATVSIKQLAYFAMIEASTLSRMLQRLESEGYLTIAQSDADGRARTISLTEAGTRKYEEVREITLKHVSRIVHGFSKSERQRLMSFILQMRENVESLPLEENRPRAIGDVF